MDFIQRFIEGFHHAVIYDQRYLVYLDGLKVTILISIFAILIGVAIGLFIAVVKVTVSKNIFVRILKWFCNVYTTVIRGTPVMVQLLIMYNMVFTARDTNEIFVGVQTCALPIFLVSTRVRMWLRLSERELNPLTEGRWRQVVHLASTIYRRCAISLSHRQ